MKVVVIGAGVMGSGIAQVCAMANHQVVLYDINAEMLSKAQSIIEKNLDKGIDRGKISLEQKTETFKNLHFEPSFEALQGDLIIEAVIERLDLKVDLFQKLAAQNSSQTILATNTSSIPITQIAAQIPHPERVLGIHFFNPAHIMKLVEVVSGAHTDPALAQKAMDFVDGLKKVPILAQDAPGFIVNRVARHFYVEGLKVLEEGVADHKTIDGLMQNFGFKMGPFQLMDLIGVETNYKVTSSMFELFNYDSKFRPSRIQKQKVDAGHHGRKTGKGFYEYN